MATSEKSGVYTASLYLESFRMGVESAGEFVRLFVELFKLDPKKDLNMTPAEIKSIGLGVANV